MILSGLTSFIQQAPAFERLVNELRASPGDQVTLGLLRAARAAVTAALHAALQRPILVVATQSADALQLYEQIRLWAGQPHAVYRYPEPDVLPNERMPWASEMRQERLTALAALAALSSRPGGSGKSDAAEAPIVVSSIRALLRKTLPPREFLLGVRTLRVGQIVNLNSLLSYWYEFGYDPVKIVEEPGSYSRRGGIIDVYSPQWTLPVRVELFGDEVDSLRTFDPSTQRSLEKLQSITIIPAREALPKYGPAARERFASLACDACHTAAREEFERDLLALEQSEAFQNIEFYIPYLYSRPASLLDYVPDSTLLLLDDPAQLRAKADEVRDQSDSMRRDMLAAGELPEGIEAAHFTWSEVQERLMRAGRAIVFGHGGSDQGHPLGEAFAPSPRYGGQVKRVLAEWGDGKVKRARDGRAPRTVVISRQVHRLADLLTESGLPTQPLQYVDTPPVPGSLSLVQGSLSEGWTLAGDGDGASVVVLTDAEIFGLSKPEPRRPRPPKTATTEQFFADVEPGDYVVHMEHGIGRFDGLVKLTENDIEGEYLKIDYAEDDHLYVPVYQVDRLSRYVGGGDVEPSLHRLGSGEWPRTKERARKAVEDIAEELLDLYAARQVVEGHAFGGDSQWQRELEASFPYVETEDQLQAIEAVKQDLESQHPMDRLVTGDVGYGKTEVALRAAFKVVNEGKQVAVLVPTTVLAAQHFQTFRERMGPFPVEVEMLSRFRSHKEQENILKRLAEGRIDIVIGTHRLIQKDVHFKDLGLVIIDEEQRFGVTHKERLKQLRKEVDVLTLTATPIPRTLYMALTGARDMSTIDTPPDERLPIKTRIAEFDENLIRQAILRELNRGGQVYFVHNRVRGIEQIARQVQSLVPDARVAIGHGQMPEAQLEKVMVDFVSGEIDVLVCTSIIESGLDIPNANTMIINRADAFGLAQLYQLRGRIGRSAVRAYAYLLYPKNTPLSDVANRRLAAIAEASQLGAGFQVAMYDLEIRGAGEFLGRRQHGHIAAVGFDLYTRMLSNAVDRLKRGQPAVARPGTNRENGQGKQDAQGERPAGESEEQAGPRQAQPHPAPAPAVAELADDMMADLLEPDGPTVQINLPIAALLPESYVPDTGLRLQLYRRMARLRSEAEIEDMRRELIDRFGPLPGDTVDLLYQLQLKVLALAAEVEAIATDQTDEDQIVVRTGPLGDGERRLLGGRLRDLARVGRQALWLPLDERERWRETLPAVLRVLSDIRSELAAKAKPTRRHGER